MTSHQQGPDIVQQAKHVAARRVALGPRRSKRLQRFNGGEDLPSALFVHARDDTTIPVEGEF